MFLKIRDSGNPYHTALLRESSIIGIGKVKGEPDKVRFHLSDGKEFIADNCYLDEFGKMTNLRLDLN